MQLDLIKKRKFLTDLDKHIDTCVYFKFIMVCSALESNCLKKNLI